MRLPAALSLALLLASTASTPSDDQLAASGHIRDTASVKTSVAITIHAKPEKVWQILTNIDAWPQWQSDITAARLSGPLTPGTTFTWTNTGTKINSRLALVTPNSALAWTGSAMGAHAIHVWRLSPTPDGQTQVQEDESMDGFLLTLFYNSKKLESADQQWLQRLKTASEQ
jgi:uncharacterized protein YndB with AHSA1/START domain